DRSDPRFIYGEYIYCRVFRTMDGGQTAEPISGEYQLQDNPQVFWKPFPYSIPDAQNSRGNFIAPIALDRRDSNRLLVGGLSLWQCRNVREPIDYAKNFLSSGPRWGPIKLPTSSPISALAIAEDNSDIVWVGHNSGDVYVSINSTRRTPRPTWTPVNDNGPA